MIDNSNEAGTAPDWESLYVDLLRQLRAHYPDLPEQMTETELRVAVDDLEKARGIMQLDPQGPMAVTPHDVLDWAFSEGPLAPGHS